MLFSVVLKPTNLNLRKNHLKFTLQLSGYAVKYGSCTLSHQFTNIEK